MKQHILSFLLFTALLFLVTSCQSDKEKRREELMNQQVTQTGKYKTDTRVDKVLEKEPDTAPPVSIKKLKDMAEKGNTNAQLSLGKIYFEGRAGEKQNYQLAFTYFTQGAEGGNGECMYNLGVCYEGGFGVSAPDLPQAIAWYRKAADVGISQAQIRLVRHYESTQQADEEFKYIQKLAESHDPTFLYKAGLFLLNANGTQSDPELAAKYLTEAAELEYVPAMLKLADCYQQGIGVPCNFDDMFFWLNSAAHTGNPEAQAKLGYCYMKGMGIIANQEKAAFWLKLAAEAESVEAMLYLGIFYEGGYGVEADRQKAMEYYSKAAEKGHPMGQYEVGMAYLENVKGESLEQAEKWLTRSADQGYHRAQIQLGLLLMEDKAPERHKAGDRWLQQAIPGATPDELRAIALAYFGTKPDLTKQLLQQAAAGKDQESVMLLQELFEK